MSAEKKKSIKAERRDSTFGAGAKNPRTSFFHVEAFAGEMFSPNNLTKWRIWLSANSAEASPQSQSLSPTPKKSIQLDITIRRRSGQWCWCGGAVSSSR
jgi:hypothetical protein